MLRTFGVIVLVGSVTSSCSRGADISSAIGTVVNAGPGSRITLSELAQFPWDKVCVFGPYTPDDRVDAVTGVPGSAAQAYDIRSNDGIDVLMFLEAGQIKKSIAHSRERGDFGPEVVGKCYLRDHAVFSVREPPVESWGNIGPLVDTAR
jgi:hypothetical protein